MQDRFELLKNDYVRGFPAHCGFIVERVESGFFESSLEVRSMHKQQDGFVHAGVIATMADHTAGYSAYTTVSDEYRILTIEFKINYFKPAIGDRLRCISRVINGGRKIVVSESEVFSIKKQEEKMISKATVTLMAVPVKDLSQKKKQVLI